MVIVQSNEACCQSCSGARDEVSHCLGCASDGAAISMRIDGSFGETQRYTLLILDRQDAVLSIAGLQMDGFLNNSHRLSAFKF